MLEIVRKRDGSLEEFDINKVEAAIAAAVNAAGADVNTLDLAWTACKNVKIATEDNIPTVEEILDAIEVTLMREHPLVAKRFIIYRNRHQRVREQNSVYSRAIEGISLGLEMQGTVADYLAAVAYETSYQHYLMTLLPQEITHYFVENFIWVHGLPYFGRAPLNIAIDVNEALTKSPYLATCGMKPAKRAATAIDHVVQLYLNAQNEIGGAQAYPNFDTAIAQTLRNLTEEASKKNIRQAIEHFLYTLNVMPAPITASIGTTTPTTAFGPHLNIGADTTPEGKAVTEAILDVLATSCESNRPLTSPPIVFTARKDGDNRELLEKAAKVASARGNFLFVWEDDNDTTNGHFADGTIVKPREVTGMRVSLNLPKLAILTGDQMFEEIRHIAEAVTLMGTKQRDMYQERTEKNFRTITNIGYLGDHTLHQWLSNATIEVSLVGLSEAVTIIANGATGKRTDMAGYLLSRLRSLFAAQTDYNIKLVATRDADCAARLYDTDASRGLTKQHGISGYTPGANIVQYGGRVKDFVDQESTLFAKFESKFPLILRDDPLPITILEAVELVRDLNAGIAVP